MFENHDKNLQNAKRFLIRISFDSDDIHSLQRQNHGIDRLDSRNVEPTIFVPRNNRYRNSVEYQFMNEIEQANTQMDRMRFPSFESTIGSNFQKMINQEDQKVEMISEDSFYNEYTFDLEADAKKMLSSNRVFSDAERKIYWNLISTKARNAYHLDRNSSVNKYKIKKARRKMVYKIRYKVRQDLAIKRLRNKGKFIKSKKIDIRTAANMILIGLLIRKRTERKKRV